MRVVLDANVIIAAFAARGLCESVLELCLSDHEIVISEYLLAEVQRHLIGKINLPSEIVEDIIALLREQGTMAEPSLIDENACRDKNDLPILGTAVASGSDCIITGDKDLLVLKQYENAKICSPREFADAFRRAAPPSQGKPGK